MGNDNKGSFLLLNKTSYVVNTILEGDRLLARGRFTSFTFLLSSTAQTFLLLNFGLRPIFVKQFEQLCSYRVGQDSPTLTYSNFNTLIKHISTVMIIAFLRDHHSLRTCLPVEGLCELVYTRGNLQPLVENGSLPLQTYILGPTNKPRQVTFWLDITSCMK